MKLLSTVFIIATTLIGLSNSRATAQDNDQWNGSCEITFSGKSTLHNFAGTVKTEPFTVAISDLTQMSTAKVSGRVKVKVAKMDTKSAKRDAKMHDVLQVAAFPDIVVDVTKLMASSTKPVLEGNIPRPTVIPFTLTIKGGKQQLIGKVGDWSYSDKRISCTVSFPVSLKASNLVVPTVLGFIKVQDQILVVAKLTLKKSE